MTVGQLKDRYREVFGEDSRSNHKQFLFRRIAWRIQANVEGGLSERARRRALEIANETNEEMVTELPLGHPSVNARLHSGDRPPASAD